MVTRRREGGTGDEGKKLETRCRKGIRVVRLAGLEPAARGLGNRCSILLSYRRIGGEYIVTLQQPNSQDPSVCCAV